MANRAHREDGAAAEWIDGDKIWYVDGKYHREDGPAIERASGHKEWWINGELHRTNGPAVEHVSGSKEWWINEKNTEKMVQLLNMQMEIKMHGTHLQKQYVKLH